MKTLVTAASIAALIAFPMAAEAKHKHKHHHKGMEGSPNAAGYKGKDDAGKADAGGKDNPAASEKMKGPPNANGATDKK